MLLSLIPGLGTIAYFASGPMLRSGLARLLIGQFAYKLPLGLYRRLHLARITAPHPSAPGAKARRIFPASALRPDQWQSRHAVRPAPAGKQVDNEPVLAGMERRDRT